MRHLQVASYNGLGHRTTVQYPGGSSIALSPNALGQARQAGSYASNATYHPNGALKGFTYGDGHTYSLLLNTRQLPQKRREVRHGNTYLDYNYEYDKNGNLVWLYDLRPGGNESRALAYDALDRMTQAHGPDLLGFEHYGYDALDNLRSASFTGSMREDLYITWQMNAASNRLASIHLAGQSHFYSHDNRGNHTSGLSTALVPYTRSFNARNQLTGVSLPGQTDQYRYDGHGRRTSIQRNGLTTSQLYSRDGQLLYERSPSGQITRHVHLGGRLVASIVGGITTYQHTDHLGSPIRRTNTAGTETGMTLFAPYGSLVAGTVGQGPGFTGHVNDTGSGLVYMQQRHYDPIAMRFVSADPVHVDTATGGNFNRYWYANNNPYRYVDPDGRYGRGAGFTDKEWRTFDRAQQRAAGQLEKAAARIDKALDTGKGMGSVTRAFERTFGNATPERMAQASSTMKDMAGALRDDGSGGFVANMMSGSEMSNAFRGADSNTAAGVPPDNRFQLFVNRDHPSLASRSMYSWIIGHEAAHGVGVEGHGSVSGISAYRYGSEAQERAFRLLPGVDPEAALRNPDSLMRFSR